MRNGARDTSSAVQYSMLLRKKDGPSDEQAPYTRGGEVSPSDYLWCGWSEWNAPF